MMPPPVHTRTHLKQWVPLLQRNPCVESGKEKEKEVDKLEMVFLKLAEKEEDEKQDPDRL